MDSVDLVLMALKNTKKVSGNKKNKVSINSFKKLYQTITESAIRREKEAENRKRYRLAAIIQKLLAGIPLTSDEMQFLKATAPMYYNQAMRQQRSYLTKTAGHDSIGEIEPITYKTLL